MQLCVVVYVFKRYESNNRSPFGDNILVDCNWALVLHCTEHSVAAHNT